MTKDRKMIGDKEFNKARIGGRVGWWYLEVGCAVMGGWGRWMGRLLGGEAGGERERGSGGRGEKGLGGRV